ncbi:MAG: HD-GYP domain-containing protein [Lachnospiraceae bacterium]
MVRRYFKPTRVLQSGMRIDQTIADTTGRVLIARGTFLDDYLIDAIRKLGITGIYIREGEEEVDESLIMAEGESASPETLKKIEKLSVADRTKVQLTESVRERVAEGISYLFTNTSSSDFASATKTIADDLMKAIYENDALAVDIGLLKVSDEYTFKHSVDVATMAMVIAKKREMSQQEVYDIGISGLLHDIGKSKIPNEILNKPGRLTDEEFAIMKQHPAYGYQILKENKDLSDMIKLGVLQHHEKINGKGYPMGVDESKISSFAKIISVADIYDALVTERPYKHGFSPRDAVEMIMAMTEELDIDAMKGFLGSVILYPVGSTVELSNGEKARVVENYEKFILRPKVVGLKTGRVYDLANDMSCASIIIQ